MSSVWITIAALTVFTVAIKAAGPVAAGGRELSPPALRVITLLAPTVLAALVVVETFAAAKHLSVDARFLGLLAGGAAIGARMPLAVVVLAAAGVAAGARALGVA